MQAFPRQGTRFLSLWFAHPEDDDPVLSCVERVEPAIALLPGVGEAGGVVSAMDGRGTSKGASIWGMDVADGDILAADRVNSGSGVIFPINTATGSGRRR